MRQLLTFAYSIFTLIKLCKQPIFQSNMNKHTEMEEVIVESSLSRLKWMEGGRWRLKRMSSTGWGILNENFKYLGQRIVRDKFWPLLLQLGMTNI